MKSRRRVSWRYLLAFAALTTAAAIALANPPRVMSLVIEPVTRLSWWMTRTLLMVDPEIYWTALIFIILAFGVRLLPERREAHRPAAYVSYLKPTDRAAEWEKLIQRGDGDEEGRKALLKALQELQVGAAQCAGQEPAAAVELPGLKRKRLAPDFRRRMTGLLRRITRRDLLPKTEYEAGVAAILDRLESMMEKQNDT